MLPIDPLNNSLRHNLLNMAFQTGLAVLSRGKNHVVTIKVCLKVEVLRNIKMIKYTLANVTAAGAAVFSLTTF